MMRHQAVMMIYLVRHARPAFDMSSRIVRGNLAPLIKAHDQAGIDDVGYIPVLDCPGKVFSSDITRARHSAERFFPSVDAIPMTIFRETPLPARLPLRFDIRYSRGLLLARGMWLCGYAPDIETLAQAQQRAACAASILHDAALTYGMVALVGHGVFNRLIGRALTRSGWALQGSSGSGFGSFQNYRNTRA